MRIGIAPVLAIALVLGACASAPRVGSSRVYVRVLDEAKRPLSNAAVAANGTVITHTKDDGLAEITVSGRDGATFPIEVRCPATHRSPDAPLVVRRVETGPSPEYVARCEKLRHQVVIAIRTDGAGNMPVIHLGKEVARTDEHGSAHVLVEGDVHSRVDLHLDTRDPKFAKIHPQNPIFSTEVTTNDDVRLFEVKFTRDKKPVARAAKPVGPKAL